MTATLLDFVAAARARGLSVHQAPPAPPLPPVGSLVRLPCGRTATVTTIRAHPADPGRPLLFVLIRADGVIRAVRPEEVEPLPDLPIG